MHGDTSWIEVAGILACCIATLIGALESRRTSKHDEMVKDLQNEGKRLREANKMYDELREKYNNLEEKYLKLKVRDNDEFKHK